MKSWLIDFPLELESRREVNRDFAVLVFRLKIGSEASVHFQGIYIQSLWLGLVASFRKLVKRPERCL